MRHGAAIAQPRNSAHVTSPVSPPSPSPPTPADYFKANPRRHRISPAKPSLYIPKRQALTPHNPETTFTAKENEECSLKSSAVHPRSGHVPPAGSPVSADGACEPGAEGACTVHGLIWPLVWFPPETGPACKQLPGRRDRPSWRRDREMSPGRGPHKEGTNRARTETAAQQWLRALSPPQGRGGSWVRTPCPRHCPRTRSRDNHSPGH